MTNKLQEDTVSADRKERIIFDADAWRKKDKSGKKTSAITSRQNFDNEKFTRNTEKVDEGTIQPSGDSKVDSAGPTQSDAISKDLKPKKSNNSQIEFVTGTANPNGSSSTAIGGAQATGRKLAEALVKKARAKVKADSCMDEGVAGAVSGAVLGAMTGGPLGAIAGGYLGHKVQQGANASKAVKKKIVKEEETSMSKTYTTFMEELDQLVEFVVEENQLNEYNAKDGVYRHKGTYGGGYSDPEGADDADDKPKAAPAPAVKKGRGRPAGSYGTYKARSAETKAAAAAKSAASKAANKSK